MKRSLAALSACAALLAGCVTQPPQATAPAGTPSQSPAPKPVAHVGQTLDLMRIGGQKIAVTLTEVVSPATVPNDWGAPGKTYVATKLRIENTGTTTIVGNSNSDVSVIGSNNETYQADFATAVECQDFTYGWFLLAAGSSASGCVVFALPPGVSATKVRYSPSSGISRDVGEWLNP
ncbi:DUF4352 domain-containing protein [Mycobacterium sp. M1]|uniref:DUF4352 domain-containing protein n=1 Tax=Mycolicibacter acidiphilus TaxID=2835306 RepID=A0ABS5RLQ4_9MYCO|nr:DUF4352 domain-containing protein [Mycolicibacter acidiphilus]MBS9534503.1 DUF4352 domain-containing protein [Mycolicibacter acidiphilus]